MKRLAITIVPGIIFAFLSFAHSAPVRNESLSVFDQANTLYQQEQYQQAAETLEVLVNKNQANSELYYNLGNAYYRLRQPGRAILNYERALRLSPRDGDTRYNLAFVRSQLNLSQSDSMFDIITGWLAGIFSLNELIVLCSFFWTLLCAGLITYLYSKSRALLLFDGLFFVFFIFFAGWFGVKYSRDVAVPAAIVTTGPVEARNGPGMDNSVGFTLPEGRKVLVLGEKDEWAAVGIAEEGLKGWVEKKYIDKI